MAAKQKKKVDIKIEALQSWLRLNTALNIANEAECKVLLDAEKKGRGRKQFLYRIHSRLNKLRAQRERRELGDIAKT